MIRDYLGAVSTAANRKLPKGDRLLFVGRTRAAIEARVGPLGSADADEVAAALTALGDPEELAAKERDRLYRARRRGAAAEPPKLWKPPGKTSRRGAPPGGQPARGGEAGPQPRGGTADARPRRSRSWPYRRSGPDDPALPGQAGSAGAGPAKAPGPAQPPELTGPLDPAEPPAPAGPTVGPGMAGAAGWLASPGTAGPGTPPGTAGPGAPGGTVGPGAANGRAGPGIANGTAGPGRANGTQPGASSGTVGPGASSGSGGPGTSNGTAGAGTSRGSAGPGASAGAGPPNGTGEPGTAGRTGGPGRLDGTAGPGALNGTVPGGPHGAGPGARAPGGRAGDTAPIPPAAGAGPASQAGEDRPCQATPPEPRPADGTRPLSIVPGMDTGDEAGGEPAGRRFGAPAPLTEAWTLARNHPPEAVAVVLLGVGGLIFPVHPVPLWLLGGLLALRSRVWDKRDKWLALAGPVGFALICLLLLGASGSGGFFHALGHASHQFAVLLRLGCVLGAGYLVWRLRRGPRRRKTPPWLRGR